MFFFDRFFGGLDEVFFWGDRCFVLSITSQVGEPGVARSRTQTLPIINNLYKGGRAKVICIF